MQITGTEFLFIFFPVFITLYLTLPAFCRNGLLLCGSLVFYAQSCGGDWLAVAVLVGLSVLTWLLGVLTESRGRILPAAGVAVTLGCLIFLKCWESGRYLTPGMSFFTLQAAAYLMDVYRGRLRPDRNLLRYSAGLTAFPKLLSGPLVEPTELDRQLRSRGYEKADFAHGLQELIVGLAMKVLLADRLGGLWNQVTVIGYDSISTGLSWVALLCFAGRLYFDFYGYSLMAIGLGKMLGFRFPANFRDPYASRSVSEFYRRWHITLGAWFREYVYFPLGGSRAGKARTVLNLAVVWLLTGLWHGGSWNYLLWAGWLWLFITLERLIYGKWLKKSRVICHIYTVFVILLSWVPFAISDPGQLGVFVSRLFGAGGIGINPLDVLTLGKPYFILLCTGLILATPLPGRLWERWRDSAAVNIVLFALFWAAVYFVATASQDPFLYYQF